ncbi:MAG: glycosyltransferase family 4 protein [Gemmiger sp.]|uniref:glycosyltransferase family 4 protein n=1 Tax=Gemmiger sp. TaxID=2049027 RepID=UPI002E768059|nr:glycosyltransferase family 4 protein [Gemmiger sp.]MEE0799707.1 glycosyltransferase family 4 protein [Gemmiger sp.]
MLTIAIPQLYCGASGKKGAYNRQEVGLARAFAALGCRAVVLYPDPGADTVSREDLEPNVRIYDIPARAAGVSAFYRSWQVLLDEKADAVHVMGDNALGVPGLFRFCRRHGIFFYSQLGAVRSSSRHAAVRFVMDLLGRRNLAIYRRTPTYAKTPAVRDQLRGLGVPCAGVLPVGLDTAVIPASMGTRAEVRDYLHLDPKAPILVFVGRLDAYKHPLDIVPVLEALPASWQAVVIGQGSQSGDLHSALDARGLTARVRCIPQLPNTAVQAYYHACDVFVNFNPDEIFGMSLLEAMYAGCPPVARHAPGPDLIIEEGVSGFFADTPGEFARAICRAAGDPAVGHAAQKRINEHFLWTNSAETALAMLRQQGVKPRG